MAFDLAESVKNAAVLAICLAVAVYASSYFVKPHLVTRQQEVDPNLVNTYTGFTAMVGFVTCILLNFAAGYVN